MNQNAMVFVKSVGVNTIIFFYLAIGGLVFAEPKCPPDQPTWECIQKRCAEGQAKGQEGTGCKLFAGVKLDARPFGYREKGEDGKDKFKGFDIELVNAFAECWIGEGDVVEFIPVTSDNRIQLLKEREVDLLAASMTHTQEREKEIDFSQTYFRDGQALLINMNSDFGKQWSEVANDADIFTETYKDLLRGATVAVIGGATSEENINQEARKLDIAFHFKRYLTYIEAVDDLLKNNVDILTTDRSILENLAREHNHVKEVFRVIGQPFSSEPYGVGMNKGDSEFRNLINHTLQMLWQNRTYHAMYLQYDFEECFELSDESFTNLKEVLPETTLTRLREIQHRKICDREAFLKLIAEHIGKEDTALSQEQMEQILKYTLYFDDFNIERFPGNFECPNIKYKNIRKESDQ